MRGDRGRAPSGCRETCGAARTSTPTRRGNRPDPCQPPRSPASPVPLAQGGVAAGGTEHLHLHVPWPNCRRHHTPVCPFSRQNSQGRLDSDSRVSRRHRRRFAVQYARNDRRLVAWIYFTSRARGAMRFLVNPRWARQPPKLRTRLLLWLSGVDWYRVLMRADFYGIREKGNRGDDQDNRTSGGC